MEAFIQVLESTIAVRDPYTVNHQRRVTQIAGTIGVELELSEERLRHLRMAGILHDLGKIAIPSDLLAKPGKLTPLEFDLLKTHPQVAYNILKPIELPGHTAEIILQHHERLNGTGYPRGLKGHEILLEARILGVADVMEAMCSHRPYRAALGMVETLEELSKNKGILYDPAVVKACLKIYGQDRPDNRLTTSEPNFTAASQPRYQTALSHVGLAKPGSVSVVGYPWFGIWGPQLV
jgi:HD-GYP domain-containing protein (c-di-GMP phosphodiesterase class II)